MFDFSGRVAVVTGARGEIGNAIASELAKRGAEVWGLDSRFDDSDGTNGEVPMRVRRLDVTDSADVNAAFEHIRKTSGFVSLLVNGAGGPGPDRASVEAVSDESWSQVLRLNLDGLFYCSRAAVSHMKEHGSGSIVNISSGAGRTYSRTGVHAYAAAKSGVIGLTRQMARELGIDGIRVNCVAPGFVFAEPTRAEWNSMSPEAREALRRSNAMARVGSASDLVGPVLFFLSEAAGYVTGQTISADGGAVMLG